MTKRLGFYFLLLSAFLSTATAQSTIFIVRHAEKADATKDPDLSEAGRGDTIPDSIKALGISDPINIAENDYDNLFAVVLDQKPHLIRLHYR